MMLGKYRFMHCLRTTYVAPHNPWNSHSIYGQHRAHYYNGFRRGMEGKVCVWHSISAKAGWKQGNKEYKLTQLLKNRAQTEVYYRGYKTPESGRY